MGDMKREITIEYPSGEKINLTIGDLYNVEGWNKKAYFRLINVNGFIATIATVKYGKTHEVGAHKLQPYRKPKVKEFYWKHPGY